MVSANGLLRMWAKDWDKQQAGNEVDVTRTEIVAAWREFQDHWEHWWNQGLSNNDRLHKMNALRVTIGKLLGA